MLRGADASTLRYTPLFPGMSGAVHFQTRFNSWFGARATLTGPTSSGGAGKGVEQKKQQLLDQL
jgi:hypothetical protein